MRILMLNYEYPPVGGGGGVAALKLAEEWVRQGHDVDVITSHFKGLPETEDVNGVSVYRVHVWGRKELATATLSSLLSFPYLAKKKLKELCNKNNYDIINTHFAVPTGPLGRFAQKKFKIPNVLSIHGGDIYDPTKKLSPHKLFLTRRLVKKILSRSTEIVAQSLNTKENALGYYHINKDVKIIPLGFQAPKITEMQRSELGLKDDAFYLIGIGRMVRRKGFEYLVEAMAKLPENINLVFIGDGPMEKELRDLASSLGIFDRIVFAGRVPEKEKYALLKTSDLYVLSSIHEGYGIVLQEAMEAGLAIVSTNHGGQTDFLEHEKNALLVNPSSADELGTAIKRLYDDKKLRTDMETLNKKDIKKYYVDVVAKQYLDLFEKIIKK